MCRRDLCLSDEEVGRILPTSSNNDFGIGASSRENKPCSSHSPGPIMPTVLLNMTSVSIGVAVPMLIHCMGVSVI